MNAEVTTRNRLSPGYPGLLLGVAVLLSTSLLALAHISTRDAIAQREAEDLQQSLSQVLPPSIHDNDLLNSTLEISEDGQPVVVYRARLQQQTSAVAWNITAPDGYGGPIRLLLGVAADGTVLGVRVLSHAETPGLGDWIETAKSPWILGFDGHSLDNLSDDGWAVRKDGGRFDQFTGATITPRAVVGAVHRGLQFFQQRRTELLQPETARTAEASAAETTAAETTAGESAAEQKVSAPQPDGGQS